jgi:LDH2 family malate/lactate/ureidoglycolate dehydrogenase
MKHMLATCVSAHRNISLLLGRMEARHCVEFAGQGGINHATRGEAKGSRGSEAAAHRAWQAGPVTERRGSEAATRRARQAGLAVWWPSAAPPRRQVSG